MTASRSKALFQLVDLICAIERPHPVRVALDGVDAAGKTTLADELAPLIAARGRSVIRASVDGFHNSRKVRYQWGADSPEGYYRDSFNCEAILRELLIPLGPSGNRKYRLGVFNFREDKPRHEPESEAPVNAILLFDGVFLLRPELIPSWDFSIFVDVDFDVSVPRAVARDMARCAHDLTVQSVTARYNRRYVPGQKLYFAEAHPKATANVILQNNDWLKPELIIP